ncbi:choice-of-anchor Q domain-containing protein [Lysobacter sp. GCM10012299]|uniref:choice-of-anchor Q domain-containing protein n=1 Tax=Lysobacter sp. GCM10012299 TaxID=3317333 RepID=UPI00361493E9
MAQLLVLALLVLAAWRDAAAAETYYVRTDGGDEKQCNGRADAPYPGSGSKLDCAWKSPLYALPTDDNPRIDRGDTLIIGPGDYMIGWGAPGAGDDSSRCYEEAPYDCYPAAPPSGRSPEQKTRILGQGFDTGCKAPPKLWGTQRVDMVLNLQRTDNVEVGCLEITDRSDCVEFHTDDNVRCERDKSPYGDWASVGLYAKTSRNVWLHDLNIHGLAGRGIMAGHLTDWTVERVRINANGWAGWDGDVGEDESSNSGDIILRNVEIAWNGCAEHWQSGEPFACWAQENGGYGDGLGTARTDGHWLVEDSRIHHNTSDGLDLLYTDQSKTATVVVRRTYAAANAGNQIKTAGNALIENSVIIGQCGYFHKKFDMTWSDMCRAMGNALSIGVGRGQKTIVRHNTITGEGDCLILTEGGDKSSTVEILNNALIGQPDFLANGDDNNGELTCGHYANESDAVVNFSGNAFWNVKDDQCFKGNLCGRNPRLTGMEMNDFDAVPLAGSPLIDGATQSADAGVDYLQHTRPSGAAPDIGAIEVQGGKAAAPAAGGGDPATTPERSGADASAPTPLDPSTPIQATPKAIGSIVIASLLTAGIVVGLRKQRARYQ